MDNVPSVYGFNYNFNGRKFALDVMASSREEAIKRVAAMANSTFVSELVQDEQRPRAEVMASSQSSA